MSTRRHVALERFGPPEVMAWVEGPMPQRGPDEVLVAVEAIGVNFADTMVRRGEYRRDQSLEFTPGFEVAGRVIEAPDDGPAPGTTVVVFTEMGGGYADVVVAPRRHVFGLLDGLDTTTAAGLFTTGVTAWYAVQRYGLVRAGQTVLVHAAAGGLGSLTVQLCAALGARVLGCASTPEKLELVRGHGAADAFIPHPATLTAAVRERTAGRGADVVIDGVGGDLFVPSLKALAHNGRYVVVGSASQQPALLDARGLMPRAQTVCGFVVARVAELDPAEPAATFDRVQRAVLDGTLRPQLQALPATELAVAHELMESRRLTGKLVLAL
jgi:NADPH:quinone reductase